jgi:hypothetical protein
MNITAANSTPASFRTTGELTLYAGLPAPTSSVLERCAGVIECARIKTVETIFDIGVQLQIANDELAHHGDGIFGKWVVQRCRMSRSAAHDAMKVVQVFGEHKQIVCPPGGQTLDVKALGFLARDTTPEAAIKDALQLAARGERVTLAKAKRLVATYTVESESNSGNDQNSAPPEQGLANLESTMREETSRWWELCPPPDRASIPETLRRIADELEAHLGAGGHNDG